MPDELHFERAAANLHNSQPALSKQIRKLEDQLGTSLLVLTAGTYAARCVAARSWRTPTSSWRSLPGCSNPRIPMVCGSLLDHLIESRSFG